MSEFQIGPNSKIVPRKSNQVRNIDVIILGLEYTLSL